MAWKRTIEEEINRMGKHWKVVRELSKNRARKWKFTEALRSI
jgi:hypothetical protein